MYSALSAVSDSEGLEHRRDSLPEKSVHLPSILSQEELTRFIDALSPYHRILLMTLYAKHLLKREHLPCTERIPLTKSADEGMATEAAWLNGN
jgi:hypothetical protein